MTDEQRIAFLGSMTPEELIYALLALSGPSAAGLDYAAERVEQYRAQEMSR